MLYYRDFEGYKSQSRCPAVCYLKCDLYDLVDKQKKVKIDSYQALLNYRLSFTDIAVQLRISSQLSWIEKDDLFLKGFDQEFQSEILRRLKWNDRRQYVDDPWPTYQVAQEAERLLEEGYRFELREVCLARDQWSTREAQYEAEMRESRAAMAEEQCQEPEKCSGSVRPGSKASQSSSSTSLEIQSLTHSLQDSSKPLKVPGEGLRSQVVKVDSIESSFECIEVTSCIAKGSLTAGLQGECLRGRIEEQSEGKVLGVKASVKLEIPSIDPQHAEDKLQVNKQPIEAEAHALEVLKLVQEPRGDLCEVPEQARSIEVKEIKLGVEAERPSKGWTKSLGVETCTTSPSMLSQPTKQSGTTVLHVNDAHSLAPHTCSAAAVEIYASLSQKSENCLFKGYEVYGRKVEAPHSGGWSTILESTAILTTRKATKEAALRVRTPQILYTKMQKPPCVEGEARQLREGPHLCDGDVIWSATLSLQGYEAGDQAKAKPRPPLALGTRPEPYPSWCTKVSEESNEHETPSRLVCLLWRVFSVFLEDALWSGEPLSRPLLRSGNPALSHWTLTLIRGLMLSCLCEPTASIYEYLGHQERVKRWQGKALP
ncbi:hypothetical protein EDD16DRAFT_1516594 [Pisolithus croceorrhizus]|nr:hypothetical protein EV401DRAFT_1894535 [Pisolithus croceorrhizus]KAI6127608.1 hypothetical protein EDD16DRAFT_1516594 [Pisolithus croceorrhizus]KAI6162756.1 hypothetical protein EDD17DRAFT_1507885 [Pisolithus thermaeus]